MKDFNKLKLFGREYSKEAILSKVLDSNTMEEWELSFWDFLQRWFDTSTTIEVHTSGSTGKPKTIKLSKTKMLLSAKNTCNFLDLHADQKALLCMSCKHIGGMMVVVRAIYASLDLYLVQAKANPLETLDEAIDFIAIVPYQANAILDRNAKKLKQIKHIIIGGGKVNFSLKEKLLKEGISAYSTFGMTETISHIALQKIGEENHYTCLDGVSVSATLDGCLQIEAPELLEGPLKTNDLVAVLNPSQFKWLGRADFAIESGGLKMLPEIIEAKLQPFIEHNFIITSKADASLNQAIVLIIEHDKSYTLDSNTFQNLTKYEKPKELVFVKHLCYTSSGKIDRIASTKLLD